jgi:hypothetical protein
VVHATALTAAALLLASVASAQGLGDAAAREREKRKAAPAKPAKVYTEGDIGPSMTPVSTTQELPATPADASPGTQPSTEGQAAPGAAEGGATPATAEPGATPTESEEDARAQAQDAWRQQLEQARKEEAFYKDAVDRTQLQLNDTSGMYSPAWTAAQASLEDYKQKLAQTQARIASLEAEGRRNLYR